MITLLAHARQVSWKSFWLFLRHPNDEHTNKGTNTATAVKTYSDLLGGCEISRQLQYEEGQSVSLKKTEKL